ncbi:MAG TPA: TonB family protein [Vicinamibacterales bacterium]|nr:TonB family protein [Vicinamibacterales bacterium]
MSVVVHAAGMLALLFLLRSADRGREAPLVIPPQAVQMVWVPDPRPAARGGGGKPIERKTPPKAPTPAIPTPQAAPVVAEPETIIPERAPEPAAVVETAPSSSTAADNNTSQRAGIGDNDGSGLGTQRGPGSGGLPYGIGNGVTAPIPLRRPPPAYTAEAMRARLQGVVVVNCVVRPDGTCSDIRVIRSLDSVFGLDQQALASAREWRFRPGLRFGEPVAVQVTLEIAFTIR